MFGVIGGTPNGLCARVPSGTRLMSPHFCSEQSSAIWIEIIQSHYKCISNFSDPLQYFAHFVPLRSIFRIFFKFFVWSTHEAVPCISSHSIFGFSLHALDPFDFI